MFQSMEKLELYYEMGDMYYNGKFKEKKKTKAIMYFKKEISRGSFSIFTYL